MTTALHCLSSAEFKNADRLVLMDLELTCWPDSLRTFWADPRRPPEVLELGLVAYDPRTDTIVSTFSSLVRPRLNPVLSAYCLNLLRVPQHDIDTAPSLPEAAGRAAAWANDVGFAASTTCTWCTLDRSWLHDDAARVGCADPFEGWPHVNLSSLLMQALGDPPGPTPPRDAMTQRMGLAPIPDRHRALADAADLARFCSLLRALSSEVLRAQ
jgi:inhibitor of KinA sporulation pathway (predicted exonuclease)